MEIRPIISALMRSKVSMILIGLQVAMTLAIVCNALFIIVERAQLMNRPSGMNEADTFVFGSSGFGENYDERSTQLTDLAVLRQLPGVVDATTTNSVPMSDGGWGTGISLAPKQKTSTAQTTLYFVDSHGLNTFDTHLIAGRNFKQEEIAQMDQGSRVQPPTVIVTKALADKLFPDGNPIGKEIYMDEDPPTSTIVGVIDRLQEPWVNDKDVENALLVPGYMPYGKYTRYLVRAEPGRRDELMKAAEVQMAAANPSRIIGKMHSMEQTRRDAYAGDRAMMIILGTVIFCLLTITALGIVGMASFWVAQRTKQIGTRRALGASRGAILRYFLTENFLITTGGLIVGGLMTYALSLWLLAHTDGAKLLPWYYVPMGFVSLWILGQIAVLGPATRAARVSPAIATRSV
ncbi:MAG: FtsX-like permease family protein [Rudaea sp.]